MVKAAPHPAPGQFVARACRDGPDAQSEPPPSNRCVRQPLHIACVGSAGRIRRESIPPRGLFAFRRGPPPETYLLTCMSPDAPVCVTPSIPNHLPSLLLDPVVGRASSHAVPLWTLPVRVVPDPPSEDRGNSSPAPNRTVAAAFARAERAQEGRERTRDQQAHPPSPRMWRLHKGQEPG
jgi:hypothetical protein